MPDEYRSLHEFKRVHTFTPERQQALTFVDLQDRLIGPTAIEGYLTVYEGGVTDWSIKYWGQSLTKKEKLPRGNPKFVEPRTVDKIMLLHAAGFEERALEEHMHHLMSGRLWWDKDLPDEDQDPVILERVKEALAA